MSSVDERVVDMKFNNDEFGRKAADTIGVLGRLKSALGFGGAAVKGIDQAAQGMSSLQGSVGGVTNAFSGLQAMAFGAFASIGAKAATVGTQMAEALSVAPIKSGYDEYKLNLSSIGTILSNTQAAGTTLEDVNATLQELNDYSDETIYNFGQMANAIGLFTANGVDLEKSAQSIKGIANLSALSGSSAEQAAGLYRQLSQAIASGKVSLMDWTSVITAGVGGTVFQRALAQTAVAMGELDENAVKLSGKMQNVKINGESFRDSISSAGGGETWLSSDVLVNTLRTFTGEMKASELAAMGFKQAQIDSILKQGKTAKAAAQDVKSLSQAWDIAKETAGSGWSYTWQMIMGDFAEAKTTFTGFSEWINGFIKSNADARNEVLQIWKKFDGRKNLITGLVSIGHTLQWILQNIGKAWREIFPATTGYELAHATKLFKEFLESLRPSKEAFENIRRTAAGFFAILGIGWELIKAAAGFIQDLVGALFDGGGGFLDFTGNVGDFLVSLHKAIKEGEVFQKFFDRLRDFIQPVIDLIRKVAGVIADIFTGTPEGRFSTADAMDRLSAGAENLGDIADEASAAWKRFMDWIGRIVDRIKPFVDKIKGFLTDAAGAVGDFLSDLTFDDVVAGIATGSFAVLVAAIRKFLKNFDLGDLFGGTNEFLDTLKGNLEALTGTLKGMQNALNAAALLGIAVAIGVLTISVMALAKIPADDLKKASIALGTLLTEIGAAAFVFSKLKPGAVAKMVPIALGLLLIATAMVIFTKAVEKLAKIKPDDLQKGAAGLAELLIIVGGYQKLMSLSKTKSMIGASLAMIALATAIVIMAEATEKFSGMEWEQIERGLAGVAGVLVALGLFTKFSDVGKTGVSNGLGIIAISAAILILAKAMEDIADMDWKEMGKGLGGMAAGLGILVGAIKLLPEKGTTSKAVGIFILVTSLLMLAKALQDMAGMTWQEVARALVTLAGALGAMVGALKAVAKSMVGAVALGVLSVGLLLIAEALEKMGKMSWADIGAALFTMAVALGIIVGFIALVTLTGVGLPAMAVFAVSLIIIAGALWIMSYALERLGAMSWSDIGAALGGLTLLFIVLAIGGVLSPLILALAIALLPLAGAVALMGSAVENFGEGILAFAEAMERLSKINPEQLDNLVSVLEGLIGLIPSMGTAAAQAVVNFIAGLGEGADEMATAAGQMIDGMIQVMTEKTGPLVAAFVDMILQCLTALDDHMSEIIQKGAQVINKFLLGMAEEIPQIAHNASKLIQEFILAIGREAGPLAGAAAKALVAFLNGLAKAIRDNTDDIRKAAANIGDAILDGILGGVNNSEKRGSILDSLGGLAMGALSHMNGLLAINSPSKKFMKTGNSIIEGLAVGVGQNHESVFSVLTGLASQALSTVKNVLGINSPSKKFQELGKWSVLGFAKGLKDATNRREVQDAYEEMSKDLLDFIQDTKSQIDDLVEKRKELAKDGIKSDERKEYDKLGAQLTKLRGEYWKTVSARKFLLENLDDENSRLKDMAARYDKVTDKLEEAQQKLEEAKRTRDDYNKSIDEQYKEAPDFDGKTNLEKFKYDFEQRIKKTQEFATAIQKLRQGGLNDDLYKELLAQGPDSLPFVQQILEGGPEAIKELNGMQSQLTKEADALGDKASSALYQAGVNAAAGLVEGLKKEQKAINDFMEKIAQNMVDQLKKKLGIKSPSRVMKELGVFTGQGMAEGLKASTPAVVKATEGVGTSAIDGMRKTLTGLGDLISAEMDTTPVIAPVLDLDSIRKDASVLGTMLTVKPIDIQSQLKQAKDAAAGLEANAAAYEALAEAQAGDHISFTQINNSPKALSPVDIYRQTSNQLSRVRK